MVQKDTSTAPDIASAALRVPERSLIETALASIRDAVGADGASIVGAAGRLVVATVGLDTAALRIAPSAMRGEPRWIEDAHAPNPFIRSAMPYAAGILPLGNDLAIVVVRRERGPWRETRAAEAFLPLLARIVASRDEAAAQVQRLHDTIANVPGIVWEEWFDRSYRYISNRVATMIGFTVEETLAMESFLEMMHPEDRERVHAETMAALAEASSGSVRYRVPAKDGSYLWCESNFSAIRDGDGNAIGIRGVTMDITDRKLAEELLRKNEERVRELLDAAPAMLWTINTDGECEIVSRRYMEHLGLDASEVTGNSWIEFLHPDEREQVLEKLGSWLEKRVLARTELRLRSRSQGYRKFLVEAAPRYAPDGTFLGLIGSCADLTDRDRLEQQIEERKRLAGLGRLAATIAHEINNVLMGIQPFAGVILRTTDPVMLQRAAKHISNSIDRGRRVTHAILRYAHNPEPELAPIDVAQWLYANLPELEVLVGAMVQLDVDIEPGLHALADKLQLQQVLTNLATNARDAMSGHGRMTISVRQAGEFVHFAVTDTGSGIAADIVGHIFEPLFTTKSGGTGLGLAVTSDIVQKHGGTIRVESTPAGTTMHVLIPSTTERVREEVVTVTALPPSVRRVMLVEDEAPVAAGLSALLQAEGVETAIVDRGSRAMAVLERFVPDVVLLDLGLPDEHGSVVCARIRAAYPDLPLLFSTGHGGEGELEEFLRQPRTGYLLKPYDFEALCRAVTEVVSS